MGTLRSLDGVWITVEKADVAARSVSDVNVLVMGCGVRNWSQ